MTEHKLIIVDAAPYDNLHKAVVEYLSEVDNPVPDYMHRKTLRDRLRKLVEAPSPPEGGTARPTEPR